MMQVTRAAFQAKASLNEQATDPKSHTLVKNVYTSCSFVPLPANSDGRPQSRLRSEGLLALIAAHDDMIEHPGGEEAWSACHSSTPLLKLQDSQFVEADPMDCL